MELGGVNRASPASAPQPAARPDAPASQGATKTELTPAQTVQQPSAIAAEAVRVDVHPDAQAAAQRISALQRFIETRNEYDVKSREMLYQVVNTHTGEVVRQYPDDLALKLRAFVRDLAEKKEQAAVENADHRVARIA